MTQKEFAKKCGVESYETVSRWENGAQTPHFEHLQAMVSLLGLTLDQCLILPESYDDKIDRFLDRMYERMIERAPPGKQSAK